MDLPLIVSDRPRPERHSGHLTIGCLIYPEMDQIDFTGPYEVLSRIPDTTIHVLAKTASPVRDVQGLILTPEMTLAAAPVLDVMLVPGGYGQRALMEDEEVLSFIRRQYNSGRLVFSVCTGALLCGAAGILRGRQATTHWAARDLLPYYGATVARARVVIDGNVVSAAGVTAGIDAALVVAALLRGDPTAEQIQLSLEYAPDPVFQSGTPETASRETLESFHEQYREVRESREAAARRFAERAGILTS